MQPLDSFPWISPIKVFWSQDTIGAFFQKKFQVFVTPIQRRDSYFNMTGSVSTNFINAFQIFKIVIW